ncbi:hypothetical protein BJ508DRAFT_416490 [Ascobolus immersus RN42]|uniref:Extracellular membrane protein CFEM domain-containing protein n=1 Tax=Ascobolus immersus RN42 TaxID=1160509 RepID=A0A3N4HZS4_ASCIM|nr:hypothetical protein BJ508DRAFT_416490 [Ascobolus immersus RN42]
MLLKKLLLLGLPVIAMAATTTTDLDEEAEDELTTTTKATTTSGFKISTTTSSSASKVTDDEEEEEEEEEDEKMTTITTTSKGAKVTQVVSVNSTKAKNDNWPYEGFGDFILELPECTRFCFETPVSPNITVGEEGNCAKADNWNCLCHFYNPTFYQKVFNDTLPKPTTTSTTRAPRRTGSTTTTTEEPEATETDEPETPESIAKDEFFTCLEDACGILKWGAYREQFMKATDKLNTHCLTEEKVYDKERNDEDFQAIEDAKKALEAKKKAEAEKAKKNDAGKLGMGVWAVSAVAALTVAFAL